MLAAAVAAERRNGLKDKYWMENINREIMTHLCCSIGYAGIAWVDVMEATCSWHSRSSWDSRERLKA